MPIVDNLATIPEAFTAFCSTRGIVYERQVRRDMLAAVLSSQLVLLAGPSGTGKSTGARVLAEFFSPPAAVRAADIRPLWSGPDGLVGYLNGITNHYEPADGLRLLQDLAASGESLVPFLILEEANLSPMEVYLGTVITSLSSLATKEVRWRLHWALGAPPTGVPAECVLTPYPRFLATINVDSTADAPSAKVCGRGMTLLLEAPSVDLAIDSTQAINATATPLPAPPGAAVLGDPRNAWTAFEAAGETAVLTGALTQLCEALKDDLGANYVSPRDIQRCVLFMAWHVGLAEHDTGFTTIEAAAADAAELALLHVVLPGLGSGQFNVAVTSLEGRADPGGLLKARLARVLSSTKGIYGAPPDFWAALS